MRVSGRTRVLLLAAVFVLTGCAGPPTERTSSGTAKGFPVTISGCGHTSKIRSRPRRAVTLNQGATQMALALGVSTQLAGTSYLDNDVPPRWKAAYDKVPVLAKDYPSKEKLLATKPDFVYGTFSSAFEKDGVGPQAEFDRLGIPSYLSPFGCAEDKRRGAVEWATVWSEITEAGKAFGVPERARSLVKRQQATVDKAREANTGKDRSAFWFDSGDKTPYAGAGHGGPQLIMNTVGLRNIFADQRGGWASVNWEKVIAADPEVIVLADAGFSTARQKLAQLRNDPALRSLQAVRENNIVVVPFDQSNPGVTLPEGAGTVSEKLAALNR